MDRQTERQTDRLFFPAHSTDAETAHWDVLIVLNVLSTTRWRTSTLIHTHSSTVHTAAKKLNRHLPRTRHRIPRHLHIFPTAPGIHTPEYFGYLKLVDHAPAGRFRAAMSRLSDTTARIVENNVTRMGRRRDRLDNNSIQRCVEVAVVLFRSVCQPKLGI